MITTYKRKYSLPLLLSLTLVIYLALWVTYEMFNSYSSVKRRNEYTVATLVKITEELIKNLPKSDTGKLNAETVALILTKISSRTAIKHIQLDTKTETLICIGSGDPTALKGVVKGSTGTVMHGNDFYMWKTIQLRHRPVPHNNSKETSIDVKPTRQPAEQMRLLVIYDTSEDGKNPTSAKLFLVLLLLGAGGATVFFLAWTFSIRNRELKEKLEFERRRKEQLEELSLAAAGLAHETKNPLGVIRGLAQQIEANKNNPEKARNMARDIMEESDITTARLGDFLSFARIRKPELKPVRARELVTRLTGLLTADFDEAGAELICISDDITIMADHEMLSQMMMNLLLNSLQALDGTGFVKLSLKRKGLKKATLIVEDNGCGISAELLPEVCKPYINKREGGSGIGLAIVKRVAEQSGWHIGIKSTLGEGTEVTISSIGITSEDAK